MSSSTKLCAVAFALVANEYKNTYLYYVIPEKYTLMGTFSEGVKGIEVFSPRIKFEDLEKVILKALEKNKISSLTKLNALIAPDDKSKAIVAKLSYYVKKMKDNGYVVFERGKRLELTERGIHAISTPRDNADRFLAPK